MKSDLRSLWALLCCLLMATSFSVVGCDDDDDDDDDDTGTETTTDTGTEPVDTGTETEDTDTGTGTETEDTGTGPVDTGTGSETVDTGTGTEATDTDTDTGTEATDTDTGTGTEATDTDTGTGMDIQAMWEASAHADTAARSFNHWNEPDGTDTEAFIPTECAKCHSTTGFQDFIGEDGSAAGAVDEPVPPGEVVSCEACHNDAAEALTAVTFPSGITVEDLGSEAVCLVCHQGTNSTEQVDEAVADIGMDEVDEGLSFRAVTAHYYTAGATKYGNMVRGAYQYTDKIYHGYWNHVSTADACTSCHNPHSLEVDAPICSTCHTNVESAEDFDAIRAAGSVPDYDGDGNTDEGIAMEIGGLEEALYAAIQAYANDNGDTKAIIYNDRHPYFFIDTNENGQVDDGESDVYDTWTPSLLKAAYNYQYSQKDAGAFAHNAKYVIQVLYDSIEDLGGDVSNLVRNDLNHFNGTSEAFRHWDEDDPPTVPGRCARCHSHEGFAEYAATGTDPIAAVEPSDGLWCETCHDFTAPDLLVSIDSVTFPSGVQIDNDAANPSSSFLCMSCHLGRASGDDVQADIDASEFGFVNPHYAAAGSILYGAQASVGFEYEGKNYTGLFGHNGASNDCKTCHQVTGAEHSFSVELTSNCTDCHSDAESVEDIRVSTTDYDGDGTDDTLKNEIETLRQRLLDTIEAYADEQGNPITRDPERYPYWFKDPNENDVRDEGEQTYGGDPEQNQPNHWDAELMAAVFNYQLAATEHGAWAHNTNYIAQLLYDSIEDLDATAVTDLNRPEP